MHPVPSNDYAYPTYIYEVTCIRPLTTTIHLPTEIHKITYASGPKHQLCTFTICIRPHTSAIHIYHLTFIWKHVYPAPGNGYTHLPVILCPRHGFILYSSMCIYPRLQLYIATQIYHVLYMESLTLSAKHT